MNPVIAQQWGHVGPVEMQENLPLPGGFEIRIEHRRRGVTSLSVLGPCHKRGRRCYWSGMHSEATREGTFVGPDGQAADMKGTFGAFWAEMSGWWTSRRTAVTV